MSVLLYYSNHCDRCKILINIIARDLDKKQISNIHFINIDRRITDNGYNYAILDNGQRFNIPRVIEKVPAIILLNEGNTVLFGNSIYQYFGLNLLINNGKYNAQTRTNIMEKHEPEPFSFDAISSSYVGVTSDKYSFLDISAEDMMAKGNGGLSQLHSYITLDDYDNGKLRIEAPEDNGDGPKMSLSINQLREQREAEIKMNSPPMY
jgi:hypothetical protein